MNNIIARRIDLTAQFEPVATENVIGTVTLTALPSNAANVILLGDTGNQVPLVPGEWHTFISVNLADIQVKDAVGDAITVIGGSW
ncbi:MAG TPA: hypothetical protein P5279_12570 [Anaerohalosphaeraceae bacterium]|nr:hypothetical protein [Anaerohalosphaeraceae bacterium]HRT51324.1 hypothetical protein [Anaerohalosphaeraceae bacterium]HRT88231.1 hypothetical protein [Anaerohalosphaeraceae bacterium]